MIRHRLHASVNKLARYYSSCIKNDQSKNDLNCEELVEAEKVNQVNFSRNAKSFREVPGPLSLPIVGTLYKYLPYIGEYSYKNLYANSVKRHSKYGPLVKETIVPGVNVISVYDPDDIEVVFKYSGKYPERRSHLLIAKFRKERPELYSSGGLLPTNGEEWFKIRSVFQKPISSPSNLRGYIEQTDSIVKDLCDTIKTTYDVRQNNAESVEDVPDFVNYLSRLNFELLCMIVFGHKINCFSEEEMLLDSFSSRLIQSTYAANQEVIKTDSLIDILEYYKPPIYWKFVNSLKTIEHGAKMFISQKKLEKQTDNQDKTMSILETYLSNPEISEKDILGISVDLTLGGIDTTSFSTGFALYHLANNQDVQDKLFEEALLLLPNADDPITQDVLKQASYLKACLKESLRINPISVGVGRIVTQDIILSGYHIPQGSIAITMNHVSCGLPKYFKDPKRFLPERWQRSSEHYTRTHPFLYLPFGHGARTCIAKKLAEQNMLITLLKLVRNFKMYWGGGPLGIMTTIINQPDGPVKLIFKARNVS